MKKPANSCPIAARRDGERLKRLLRRDDVFPLTPGSDWGAGGCWLLAEALVSTVFRNAPIKGVWETVTYPDGYQTKIMHHAVVEVAPGCYIDHDGAQSEAQLLRTQRESIAEPYLAPWDAHRARRTGIECPVDALKQLRQHLLRAFKA